MTQAPPVCTTCKARSRLTTGKEVYPHRPDLYTKSIYVCDTCGGRVGCHPGTIKPLGTPADAKLRKERMKTHEVVDPLWRTAEKGARRRVYEYLAHRMALSKEKTHIGMFDMTQCLEVRRLLRGLTYQDIRLWANARVEGRA